MAFTRMDQATREDWLAIAASNEKHQQATPDRIKELLLRQEKECCGFALNQLQHALQTATRAARDGACEELVVASLCHDIGKTVSNANHAAISAEILRPYVSDETHAIILAHQDFQGRYYYRFFGMDADARRQYRFKPWYKKACQFADEWDQRSFDPHYESLPFSYFEPMIDRMFARPRPEFWQTVGRVGLLARVVRKLARLLLGQPIAGISPPAEPPTG